MRIILFIIGFIILPLTHASATISYEHRTKPEGKSIHILTIDPKAYDLKFVRANDDSTGRETLTSMAERYGAQAAINGGFFRIHSKTKKGSPAGALKIDGNWHHQAVKSRGAMCITDEAVMFDVLGPKDKLKYRYAPSDRWMGCRDVLGGAPLLIANGKALDYSVEKLAKDFVLQNHARSVFAVKEDGSWMFVAVDHLESSPDPAKNNIRGMSLSELTDWLLNEKAVWALNLDGGGSSTLFHDGKILNTPMGDADESLGTMTVRPVTDAVLVMPIPSAGEKNAPIAATSFKAALPKIEEEQAKTEVTKDATGKFEEEIEEKVEKSIEATSKETEETEETAKEATEKLEEKVNETVEKAKDTVDKAATEIKTKEAEIAKDSKATSSPPLPLAQPSTSANKQDIIPESGDF